MIPQSSLLSDHEPCLSEYILNFIHQWTFGYSEQYQIFHNYYQLNINNIKSIQDWSSCIISDEFPTYLSNFKPFNHLSEYIAKLDRNILQELVVLLRNCGYYCTLNEELLKNLREFNIIRDNNMKITTRLSLFFLNNCLFSKRSPLMAKLFKIEEENSILENGELNLFSTDQWFYFQLLLTMRISIILTENYDYFNEKYWNNEFKCNSEYCYQACFENSIKNCYPNAIVSHSNNQNEYLTFISINGFAYKFKHVVKYSITDTSVLQGLEFRDEIENEHDNDYIHLYWVGGESLGSEKVIPKFSNVIVFYHEITQFFNVTVVRYGLLFNLCTRCYLDLRYQFNLNGNIAINDKLLNKNEIKNWNHEIIYSIIHNELKIPTEQTIFDECNGNDLCEMIENCFIYYDLLANHKNSIIDKVLNRYVNVKYGNTIYNRMLMEWLFDNFTKLII